MPINIQSLFSDLIETPRQAQQRQLQEGLLRAQQVTSGLRGLAATQAPLAGVLAQNIGQRQEALRQNLGGMLGLDVRTQSEKLSDIIKGADPSSPSGLINLSKAIEDIAPTQALGLRQMAVEEQRILDDRAIAAEERERIAKNQERELSQTDRRINIQQGNLDQVLAAFDQSLVDKAFTQDLQTKNYNLSVQRAELAERQYNQAQTRLLAGDRAAQKDYLQQYETEEQLMYKASNLADTFGSEVVQSRFNAGIPGATQRALNRLLTGGDESLLTYTELTKLKNQAALGNLPKGAASDRDVALVLEGEITELAKPADIERYLRGVAKLAAINAEKQFQKIDYLSVAGGNFAGYLTEMKKFENGEPNKLYEFSENETYEDYIKQKYNVEWDIPTEQELMMQNDAEKNQDLLDTIYADGDD
tara:strand:- start:11374 stop:12627 length:1254 start_codon:yes stop_codon:yes gene_type:complete